ncbi:Uncharacterized protein MLTONO_p0164 (plasmid) [Mesorhizobium loti]|nr:Uncharacterized protein MLTONO_p0164 [Mesorhizobium loti]
MMPTTDNILDVRIETHEARPKTFGRFAVKIVIAALVSLAATSSISAQERTPDPSAWRSVSYADMQLPSADTATYADIWKDAIEANNRAYAAHGDTRFAGANAPAVEAHFVIWSTKRSVVLSVLDTATGCTLKGVLAAGVTVKLCPLRIAIYDGLLVRTLEGGRACFLEMGPKAVGGDPVGSGSYVSYDTKTKTLKTGTIVAHQAVEGCSLTLPLPPP